MSTLGGRGRGTRESCVDEHVTGYYARRGGHYADANEALGFARTVRMGDDGMDAWIFDVDETLISNIGRLGCARFSFTCFFIIIFFYIIIYKSAFLCIN